MVMGLKAIDANFSQQYSLFCWQEFWYVGITKHGQTQCYYLRFFFQATDTFPASSDVGV